MFSHHISDCASANSNWRVCMVADRTSQVHEPIGDYSYRAIQATVVMQYLSSSSALPMVTQSSLNEAA